jgi:hypothetical protein
MRRANVADVMEHALEPQLVPLDTGIRLESITRSA